MTKPSHERPRLHKSKIQYSEYSTRQAFTVRVFTGIALDWFMFLMFPVVRGCARDLAEIMLRMQARLNI